MRKLVGVIATAAIWSLMSAAGASAATLGTTTFPDYADPGGCGSGVLYVQTTSDPSTPYAVPAGGGTITAWQTNAMYDTAGDSLTFVVAQPQPNGSYTIVDADTETLPNSLPSSGVASFTLAAPVAVTAGDVLGLYGDSSSDACYLENVTGDDSITGLTTSGTPTKGSNDTVGGPGQSPEGITMNVAATFLPGPQDVAVTTATGKDAVAGGQTVLDSTVRDDSGGSYPITFTDTVPAGLSISSALTGSGTCSSSGQAVSCTISGLSAGQSTPVVVVVTPTTSGSYVNKVAVSDEAGITDPNTANNSASATLAVSAAPVAAKCVVPSLKGVPKKTAEKVLKLLDCTVGKVKTEHSSLVPKGDVISASPKAGTYADKKKVSLTVSSGKKPKKKHR